MPISDNPYNDHAIVGTFYFRKIKYYNEALEKIKGGGYDCVISDVIMPDMDRLEFVRQIRKASDVPIVLYTCCSPDEVALDAKLAGVDKYIQKMIDPIHYRELADCIKDVALRTTSDNTKRTNS